MPIVRFLHPRATLYDVGYIPQWLIDHDPTPLTEQLHRAYGHGGGWSPFGGFTLEDDNALTYPGDPPQLPVAAVEVAGHDEVVFMYPHAWVAVIWPDRRFEVCRMD